MEALRQIPPVNDVLRSDALAEFREILTQPFVTDILDKVLDETRRELSQSKSTVSRVELTCTIAEEVAHRLRESLQSSLKRVINASGVILHTNLGRAPLPEAAIDQLRHVSAGYSNHLHAITALGGVDVVYVNGETSERLFAGCRTMPGPAGRSVPVPRPEHLAAMKIQAMKNDPRRTLGEMEDIRFILTLPGIDEAEVRGYFERAGLRHRYDELKRLG